MKVSVIKNPKQGIKALRMQPAPYSLQNLSDKTLFWGVNDGEPLRLIGTIQRSPAAIRCFRKLIEYTYGDGFQSLRLGAEKANKDQTFNALLRESCSPLWKLGGFSWCIKWELDETITPKISKIYSVPFESVRLGIPDESGNVSSFVYNPYFGTAEYQNKYNEIYYEFDPNPSAIAAQMAKAEEEGKQYNGQLLWVANNSEFSRFYPRPDWAGDNNNDGGGFQAMENDFLLTRLLGRDLGQGFLQNNIIKMVGDPDQPIEKHQALAADGKNFTSVGEEFKQHLDTQFQGIDGDAILVLWARIAEEFPEVSAFPTNFNYDKLKDVAEKVEKTVVSTLGVPPILAGIESSGSISKDDIGSAAYLMYSIVRFNQAVLMDAFNRVLPYWHNPVMAVEECKIDNYRPFPEEKTVDPLIWKELDAEERRNWIKDNTSFEITDDEDTEEKPQKVSSSRFAEFGVGGVQGILSIQNSVASGVTSQSAAIELLQVIYGFKKDVALRMLGVSSTPEGEIVTEPETVEAKTNDVLTNLTGRQQQNIERIVRKFKKGDLTYNQAAILLADGYGMTEDQVAAWLEKEVEDEAI